MQSFVMWTMTDQTAQDAQADLSLRSAHLPEGTFYHVVIHMC